MTKLFIRPLDLPHWDDGELLLIAEWIILEEGGSIRASGETDARGLAELTDTDSGWAADPRNIIVLIPNDYVLFLETAIPGGNRSQIQRAIPYIVEEFVAGDIEEMHVATETVRSGQTLKCAIIKHDVISSFIKSLSTLQIRFSLLLSEGQLLPAKKAEVSMLFENSSVLLKTDGYEAKIDRNNLALAMDSGEFNDSKTISLYGSRLTAEEQIALSSYNVNEEHAELEGERTIELLAMSYSDKNSYLNLLQGPYIAPKRLQQQLKLYRGVGLLAGAWLLTVFLGMIIEGLSAEYKTTSIQDESEAIYKEIFPEAKQTTNIRRQIQRRLIESSPGTEGTSQFTKYLQLLSNSSIGPFNIESLIYVAEKTELIAEVILTNYEALDTLEQELQEGGLRINILSAEQANGGLRARLRLLSI